MSTLLLSYYLLNDYLERTRTTKQERRRAVACSPSHWSISCFKYLSRCALEKSSRNQKKRKRAGTRQKTKSSESESESEFSTSVVCIQLKHLYASVPPMPMHLGCSLEILVGGKEQRIESTRHSMPSCFFLFIRSYREG